MFCITLVIEFHNNDFQNGLVPAWGYQFATCCENKSNDMTNRQVYDAFRLKTCFCLQTISRPFVFIIRKLD